jgi:hypothetical protein
MPDKAERSHIERLHYVHPDTKPGSSISYSCLAHSETERFYESERGRIDARIPCTVIEPTACGDYDTRNCLVGESNYRVLRKACPWLVEIYGSHGYKALAYLGRRENQSEALIEMIDSLTEYSCLDDSDYSGLELETAAEAWEDDGRDDWKRALVDHFDEIDDGYTHDLDVHHEAIDVLWWDCTERLRGGESHLNEQGDSIYFPIRDVMTKIERNWPGLDRPHYSGERPSIRVQLATLCTLSRSEEI